MNEASFPSLLIAILILSKRVLVHNDVTTVSDFAEREAASWLELESLLFAVTRTDFTPCLVSGE